MEMEILQSIFELAVIESAKHSNDAMLDANRCIFDPYVYYYLKHMYGAMLEEHWKTYQPPLRSEHVFMIVERRIHLNFQFILQNIAWAGPHMAVYIFCSDENRPYLEALLGDKCKYYNLITVFKGNATREQGKQTYNMLMTDYRFYELIDAKYMLTIQLDNIIRKKIPSTMFVGDYWGNPWSWKKEAAGGGGATVRCIAAMIELCRTHRPHPDEPFHETEDSWLSLHVTNYPDIEFRQRHLMESIYVDDPVIVHQPWTYMDSYIKFPRETCVLAWKNIFKIE